MIDKLNNILSGWKGYLWETPEVKGLAQKRAIECAKCDKAEWGMIPQFMDDEVKEIKGLSCGLCDCPLSTKLRAQNEKCGLGKW